MALFISHENQHMLWNTIQNVPLFSQTIPYEMQSNWFREIIGQFYNDICNDNSVLTQNELLILNKRVIIHMIHLLKRQSRQSQQILTQQPSHQSTVYDENPQSSQSVTNINSITNTDTDTNSDKDTPIENIHELLQLQEQERQRDLSVVFQGSSHETNMSQQKINDLESKVSELTDIVSRLQDKLNSIEQDAVPYIVPKVVHDMVENISLSIEEN